MNDLDDAVMADIRARMNIRVVTIKAGTNLYDGIVVAAQRINQQHNIYVIADSRVAHSSGFRVRKPNGRYVTVDANNIHHKPGNTLLGFKCADDSFADLLAVDICDQNLQDHEIVYTYSYHSTEKVLTRGSVILLDNEKGSFDHNCSAHLESHFGASVLNIHRQLVGICYDWEGYLSAHDMTAVARQMESNRGRHFMNIAAAFQNLLQ